MLISRDSKESMGFWVVYESAEVVERQVSLSSKDGVNERRQNGDGKKPRGQCWRRRRPSWRKDQLFWGEGDLKAG